MNSKIMEEMGFSAEMAWVKQAKCPFCKKEIRIDDFRDTLSIKECLISGLCQNCQDQVFGGE